MKKLFTIALGTLSMFVVKAQTLTSTGSLGSTRWQHESQLLSNGKVLTFGGDNCSSADIVYNSAELYNSSTGTWSATGSMSISRTHLTSEILPNGNVLAIGGVTTGLTMLASCELYNIATGTWSATASMSVSRYGHSSVVLEDGRVLVAGGTYSSTYSAEIYNPATGTWSNAADLLYFHGRDASMVLLNDGKVLFTGGEDASPANCAEIYDPITDTWTSPGSMNLDRSNHEMIKLMDGRILIYGGAFSTIQSEIFNPSNNTFTLTGAPSQNRSLCDGILLNDGRVFVYGLGDFFNPTNTKLMEIYNPATGTWSAPTSNLMGASIYTIVALQNNSILIIGGSSTTGNGASNVCRIVGGLTALGITENTEINSSFSVYPNPSEDFLYLKSDYSEIQIDKTEICSTQGDILSTVIKPMTNSIDISGLSSGIYYLNIYTNSHKESMKFIVK